MWIASSLAIEMFLYVAEKYDRIILEVSNVS